MSNASSVGVVVVKIKVMTLLILAVFLPCLMTCGGSSETGSDGTDGTSSTSSTSCKSYAATATCANGWTELSPTGTAPEARYAPASSYDVTNDRFMIFGGSDGTNYYGDVFVLANASGRSSASWMELAPTGTAPSGRAFVVSGYHSASNKLILFGGGDASTIYTDLWILSNANGNTPSWSNPAILGSGPSGRIAMATAYDEADDTLIIFGGRTCASSSCTLYNDVYLLTQVTTAPTWRQLSPTGTAPDARAYGTGVYDATGNRFIIFGGTTSTAPSTIYTSLENDTWVLSNANGSGSQAWTNLSPSATISARYGHNAVYDAANDRMIVFGGVNTANAALNDTWVLVDSSGLSPTWRPYAFCASPDTRRFLAAEYTGNTLDRMMIFGGDTSGAVDLNDVWVLTNANGIPTSAVSNITTSATTTTLCTTYTVQIEVHAYDSQGTEITDYLYGCISSDETIATVDEECLVTGVGTGTVTIMIDVEGITDEVIFDIESSDSDDGSDEGGGEDATDCTCYCGWPENTVCTKNSDCPDDTSVPGTNVPGVCGKPVVCATCDPI